MATDRKAIKEFALANPMYAGAVVDFWTVLNGAKTATHATLYTAATGAVEHPNPVTLDADGRSNGPIYIDAPVIAEIEGAFTENHETGVIYSFGNWRGDWVTATDYQSLDIIRNSTTKNLYIVVTSHTSGVFATDLAAGRMELFINVSDVETAKTAAQTAQAAAELAETHAETAETNAETAETYAAASAVAAAASASAASTSASSASGSASSASTSATNAAASASAASTSAGNAATSETNAGTSATAASNAASAIAPKFTFDSSTSMADPGAGDFRLNNATVASVTALALSANSADSGNPDVSDFVATWAASTNTVKGTLTLKKSGTPATFATFTITGVTDNGTWLQLAVTHVASNGAWSAADVGYLGFARAGDKGADGAGSGDMLAANNLSDVGNAATAFGNIKQAASETATGVVELATVAEAEAGADTTRAVTPAGVAAAIAALGGGGADVPIGAVASFAIGVTPDSGKYIRCSGSNVARASYANLTALPDGMTATMRTPATAGGWGAGASNGAGKIVLMTDAVDSCDKSADSGATWATATIGSSSKAWSDVVWMGGSVNKFVALSNYSANTTHAYSSDGATWTTSTTLASKTWNSIASNDAGTVVVMVCADDGTTYTSSNGTSFSAGGTLGSASSGAKVVRWMQTAGLFVVVENSTTRYWTSTNGASWTLRTLPASLGASITSVANRNRGIQVTTGALFYVGSGQISGEQLIFKTTDGINWTVLKVPGRVAFAAFNTNIGLARIGSSTLGIYPSNNTGLLFLSFDDGVSFHTYRPGNEFTSTVPETLGGFGSTGGFLPISTTAFLVPVVAEISGSATSRLLTIAIDSSKASLPLDHYGENLFLRYA
jgi:hypothetical protein